MREQHSIPFAPFYLGHTQYTATYQENMHQLLNLVNILFCVNIPAKKLDEALVQTCINPYDVYCALSAGRETEQVIRLFKKLAELRDQDANTQKSISLMLIKSRYDGYQGGLEEV